MKNIHTFDFAACKMLVLKITFTIAGILILHTLAFSQQANVWYFGGRCGLDFNGGGPATLINGTDMSGATGEGEGCTTMCDQNGALLFFSDGSRVWNRNRVLMPNGTGLTGSFTSTQAALAVPRPGSVLTAGGYPRYYYIFTIDAVTGGGNGLRYSEVDMNLNGGLGDIIVGTKNTLVQANVVEGLLSVPHFNGTDTWIVARGMGGTNNYHAFQVSAAGVSAAVNSSAGFIPEGTSTYIMKTNPCFNKIAITYHNNWHTSTGTSRNLVEILNFNNNTGIVSAPNIILDNVIQKANSADYRGVYGVEFSPSGRYLYVSELVDNLIYQYDLSAGAVFPAYGTAGNIMASRRSLGGGSAVRTGHLQIGPDGRIYTAQHVWASGISYVGVIPNPDAGAGTTWNATAYSYNFGTNSTWVCMGLPTLLRSFTAGNVTINPITNACTGTNIPVSYFYTGTTSGQTWSTTGGGTFSPSTTALSPTVNYATSGSKTITVTVTDAVCGYTRTDNTTITVYNNVTSAGTVSCSPQVGNVTAPGAYTYVWYGDAGYTQAIGSGTTNVPLPLSGSGTVYLRAESGSVPSTNTYTLLNGGVASNWTDAATTNIATFTVSAATTINSFQWATSPINWGVDPTNQSYTISIQNNAGTVTYWSNTRLVNIYGSIKTSTETPGITLAPGNYRVFISGPANPNRWNGNNCTPLSQADNAVVFTGMAQCNLGNFNYTATTYAVTTLPCSQGVAIPYNCPLPVSWLGFSGQNTPQGNHLFWATAQEKNTDKFIIERSSDGFTFQAVGNIAAAGNSEFVLNYQFIDPIHNQGAYYYRVKQTDLDGKYSYSKVILISTTQTYNYQLVPNPGNGLVYISGGNIDSPLSVIVNDIHGRFVKAIDNTHSGAALELSDLAKGIYIIQISDNQKTEYLRYVLQ